MSEKMRLYDNTRLSAYRRCPRYYYYRHVRHWAVDGPPPPELAFGSSWHAAQDVIWTNLTSDDKPSINEVVNAAYSAFLAKWAEEGMPSPEEIDYEMEKNLSPRTPGNALEMIAAYVITRYEALTRGDFGLQACELPFAVPLDRHDPDLAYIGKIDKVVTRDNRIGGIEHKTTTQYSKSSKFRSNFIDSFSPNSQVDGYLYALHLMFPNSVFGVWVDAALVHKTEQGFQFIPIERRMEQLDLWLWETRQWISRLEADLAKLDLASPNDLYMAAFPKDTGGCFAFNKSCPYLGLCKAWPNPHTKELPMGFKVEEWNPLEHVGGTLNIEER